MQVSNTYNINDNYIKKTYKPCFKQIKPEFLFINSPGYDKNSYWADYSVKIINSAVEKIKKEYGFNDIFDFAASEYSKACDLNLFGAMRYTKYLNMIDGKYLTYKDRLVGLLKKMGKSGNQTLSDFKEYYPEVETYTPQIKDLQTSKNIPLTEILKLKKIKNQHEGSEWDVAILSPDSEYIEPVLFNIGHIYESILPEKNTDAITKSIAKIHWLISQVRPFQRGTAGIADIISKALFETKGIQVSAYKEGVNPNMEAFAMPLEEYTEKYGNFFSQALQQVKN